MVAMYFHGNIFHSP